jgi:hypothetical protein
MMGRQAAASMVACATVSVTADSLPSRSNVRSSQPIAMFTMSLAGHEPVDPPGGDDALVRRQLGVDAEVDRGRPPAR